MELPATMLQYHAAVIILCIAIVCDIKTLFLQNFQSKRRSYCGLLLAFHKCNSDTQTIQPHEFHISPQRSLRWADSKRLSNTRIPRSLWATLQRSVQELVSMLSVLSSKYAFYLPQIAWAPSYEALAAQQKP